MNYFRLIHDSLSILPSLFARPDSGFKWQRQLIFRAKLRMHAAYDRQDNSKPASVHTWPSPSIIFKITFE
jgi:hypothetical protein